MTTLADKIDRLFELRTKPDGSPFSYQDVEKGTDHAVTAAYIWKLRTGAATNPGYKVLEALAHFFKVSLDYFASETPVSEAQLQQMRLAAELDKAGVAQIALRASQLDERGRQALLDMMEYILQVQGSDDARSGTDAAAPGEEPVQDFNREL